MINPGLQKNKKNKKTQKKTMINPGLQNIQKKNND